MKAKLAALMLGLGAVGLMLSPMTSFTSQAEAKTVCKTKRGKGWAWTEGMARFQAWEIAAQLSGNWPFASHRFKDAHERVTSIFGKRADLIHGLQFTPVLK
ncbi:unnamed protein product [marine sediment metagenome]|uniref:Uncharacterized protein n=1 Tax=marine sediment metagenome TaxID=412755 RepID=X0WL59_9ZZZZ